MKKAILFFVVCLLIVVPSFAQTLDDYVSEVKGNTLVIKDFDEMGGVAGSLVNAINADSVDVPADRVYELKEAGWYPFSGGMNGITRPVTIVGPDDTPMVANDGSTTPPLLSGYTDGTNSNNALFGYAADLTVKNVHMLGVVDDASFGWCPFYDAAAGVTVTWDNVLMETTKWVQIQSNGHPDNSFYITNSYFVNLTGLACRRNGGVFDNVDHDTEMMWVENCTHVMAEGMVYKFRHWPIGKAFFNHNTFVNCSGQVLETLGYQKDYTITNNLFVNANLQPYMPGMDAGETDVDSLPMGLVNLRTIPADTGVYTGIVEAERMVLVDKNGVYWDMDKVGSLADDANAAQINGSTEWVSETILYNDRTKALLDDDATYPLFTEGTWIQAGDPAFTDPNDLMTDQLDAVVEFTAATIEDENPAILDWWRVPGNEFLDNAIYPDWPIPCDLSYTNQAYLDGGWGGFPVGDLNWFPTEKATWVAQMDDEHDALQEALETGDLTPVEKIATHVNKFELAQNYPNPFNPTTTITFSIPNAGNVTLKVYDISGREVATLVNGFKSAAEYKVNFDASSLSSGVYFYTIDADGFKASKRMLLMK